MERIETQWLPELGESYYMVYFLDGVWRYGVITSYDNDEFDRRHVESGNMHRTKSEAIEITNHRNRKEMKKEKLHWESTETSKPYSGNDGNIMPAGPLKVMPKKGEDYYQVTLKNEYKICSWQAGAVDILAFQAGLCFPNTEEGKLGAELRAKQMILPPIDREGGDNA